MVHGNPASNLLIGNSLSCNPSTKAMTKTKQTLPPTGAYMSMTSWPNSLKVSSSPDLQHTLSSTTLSPQTTLAPNLAHKHMTLSTLSFPPSNTTSIHLPESTYYSVAFVDYFTTYPSVHQDKLSSILLHNGIVGLMWYYLRVCINNIRLRVLHADIQASENIKQLTSSAGSLKIAVSVPFCSVYLLLTSSMNSKLNPPTLLLTLNLVYDTMRQRRGEFGFVGHRVR